MKIILELASGRYEIEYHIIDNIMTVTSEGVKLKRVYNPKQLTENDEECYLVED